MSKEASDVALNWCIELISMSEILEPESKYAILDALKDKISSGKFSPNTEVSEPAVSDARPDPVEPHRIPLTSAASHSPLFTPLPPC